MDETWHPEHFQCYGCLVVFTDNMSYREKVAKSLSISWNMKPQTWMEPKSWMKQQTTLTGSKKHYSYIFVLSGITSLLWTLLPGHSAS